MKAKKFLLLSVVAYLVLAFAACSKTTPTDEVIICVMPHYDSTTAINPTKK